MELELEHNDRLPISPLYAPETSLETGEALRHFVTQHAERFQEVLNRLPDTHRHIVEALPCLFHHNSPSLPGWCPDAPTGIDRFTPTESQLRALRALAPANRLRETPITSNIEAIYLMGSAGSLAQTRSSDVDVWICLPIAQHAKLRKKVSLLEAWSASLGLELQIFLVDACEFRTAEPTDRGYSPLLLDEFYRSGCHIAGRYPMWWLTPCHCTSHEYETIVATLQDLRIINSASFHDFGPVQMLSPESIIASTLTLIEQSLRTPHKSLLKLGLLESYFDGAPLLSEQYKAAVLDEGDNTQRDVYTLLIKHLERHFSHDHNRIHFFRTAWLTKSIRGNSRLNSRPDWYNRAHTWGFCDEDIEHLRWPGQWSMSELLSEHSMFAKAYRSLGEFLRRLLSAKIDHANRKLLEDCIRAFDRVIIISSGQGPLHPKPVPNYRSNAKLVRLANGWALEDDGIVMPQVSSSRVALLSWLKTKGFPKETLRDHNEPWITQLWSKLGEQSLLIINAEPPPQSDSGNIWSSDLVDGREQTKLSLGDAIANAIVGEVSVKCVNTIRAASIESALNQLIASAKRSLSTEDGIFVASNSDHHDAWIRQQSGVIHRSYKDYVTLVTDLPCSHNISGLSDGEQPWLEILQGPSLFVCAQENRAELIYRDHIHKYQIAAPHRPLAHFFHSIQLFVGILSKRGVQTPRVYTHAKTLPEPNYPALGFKLIFKHLGNCWQITSGQQKFSSPTLTLSLLRKIRASVLSHRQASGEYPVYLTDLDLPNNDFHTHLVIKLRIERLLSRTPPIRTRSGQ